MQRIRPLVHTNRAQQMHSNAHHPAFPAHQTFCVIKSHGQLAGFGEVTFRAKNPGKHEENE
jgi:hypothetical protein